LVYVTRSYAYLNRGCNDHIEWGRNGDIVSFDYHTLETNCIWVQKTIDQVRQMFPRLMSVRMIRDGVNCFCDECRVKLDLIAGEYLPTPWIFSLTPCNNNQFHFVDEQKPYKIKFRLKKQIINTGYVKEYGGI
jgi:hypothetical protein